MGHLHVCDSKMGHPTHRDDFTPSEIVKHVLKENLNKSSYISTMIIHVNTAEIPQTDAGDSVEITLKMCKRIKEI